VNALKAAWGSCAYCDAVDKPRQRDGVIAISRGGRHTLNNIAPACRSCNASKGNEEVTTWLRRRRLDEGSFLLRYLEISRALVAKGLEQVEPAPVHQNSAGGST
jgi:hypothetical protein